MFTYANVFNLKQREYASTFVSLDINVEYIRVQYTPYGFNCFIVCSVTRLNVLVPLVAAAAVSLSMPPLVHPFMRLNRIIMHVT